MTKKKTRLLGMSLLAMLCLAGVSPGDTYTITAETATADGYRATNDPTGAPGTGSGYLYMSTGTWGFVEYDLAHPAGQTIDSVASATIQLTLNGYGDKTSLTFNLWLMTEVLSESSPRTFNPGELPSHDASTVVSLTLNSSTTPVNTPFNVDVSSLLANNGDLQTFGVLIIRQNSGDNAKFNTINSGAYVPKLSAQYTAVPEPATLLVLCGGAGLACLRRKKA